jgi:hypothetical protein
VRWSPAEVDRLTFVIPAFNAEATLADTLDSIRRQDRSDWRAVVVDDGSADATPEIALSLDDERIGLIRQENRGLAGARNRGYQRADTETVCFIDADDAVEPTFVSTMLATIGDADAAACGFSMTTPNGAPLDWSSSPGDADFTLERLVSLNPVPPGAIVWRRALLDRLGRPPFRPYRGCEDWDLLLAATSSGAHWARVISDPLLRYRLSPGSMGRDTRLIHASGAALLRESGLAPALVARGLRNWTLRCVANAVAAGDRELSRTLAMRSRPWSEADRIVLAGALRWMFPFVACLGPDEAIRHSGQWRARARDFLEGFAGADAIVDDLAWGPDRWRLAAHTVLARLGRDQHLVVYGLGRNGRALLDTLADTPVTVIDDDPHVTTDRPRIGIDDITDLHLVVVTPDHPDQILDRLRQRGIKNIITPEV